MFIRAVEDFAVFQSWWASSPANHHYARGSLCECRLSGLGSPSNSATWAEIAVWCNLNRAKHQSFQGEPILFLARPTCPDMNALDTPAPRLVHF